MYPQVLIWRSEARSTASFWGSKVHVHLYPYTRNARSKLSHQACKDECRASFRTHLELTAKLFFLFLFSLSITLVVCCCCCCSSFRLRRHAFESYVRTACPTYIIPLPGQPVRRREFRPLTDEQAKAAINKAAIIPLTAKSGDTLVSSPFSGHVI